MLFILVNVLCRLASR